MKTYEKYIVENDEFVYDESGSSKVTNSLSKHDSELFNEDDNKPGKSLRVKRAVDKSDGSEDWHIIDSDNVVVLNLKGSRFTSKEKEYMKSVSGMVFIVDGFKKGWRSVAEFKRNINSQLRES